MRSVGNRCIGTSAPDALTPEAGTPASAGVTAEYVDRDRLSDIDRALDTVLDPELDEPVTALGFVTRIAAGGDAVEVDFRLPTYWCSPNFAWIMAEDMRDALRALPWTGQVTVTLADHLFAAKINAAVNRGEGFGETFRDAAGDLAALRATFRRKAYLGRMAALIDALRSEGYGDTDLMSMTVGELRAIAKSGSNPLPTSPFQGEGTQDARVAGQLRRSSSSDGDAPPPPPEMGRSGGGQRASSAIAARYLELRASFGGPAEAGDPAFRTPEGDAIAPGALPLFLRGIRMTRRGAEANGEMCRIYLRERTTGTAAADNASATG
jgi:metal-sulfur cluster biosynthetic enzyme